MVSLVLSLHEQRKNKGNAKAFCIKPVRYKEHSGSHRTAQKFAHFIKVEKMRMRLSSETFVKLYKVCGEGRRPSGGAVRRSRTDGASRRLCQAFMRKRVVALNLCKEGE